MYPNTWEYATEECPAQRKHDVTSWLDGKGEKGWELVAVIPSHTAFMYFFKRPADWTEV